MKDTTKVPTTALGVLIAALKLIENPESWTKGRLWDYEGRYCSVGATAAAARGEATTHVSRASMAETRADRYLLSALRDFKKAGWSGSPMRFISVIAFNDAEETKHGEVLALFKRAIARAKRRHYEG